MTVPADWEVISVVAESEIEDLGATKVWTFPPSARIGTYIYALHAGHYRRWESMAGDIPLRLFARASVADYIYPEHWFVPTRQGFAFFQDHFDIAYPFGKYDQVIVPHFNAGAMENLGAVTFSERFLRRGTVTRQARRWLANVILHGMAHMWFGNLVLRHTQIHGYLRVFLPPGLRCSSLCGACHTASSRLARNQKSLAATLAYLDVTEH